MRFLPSLLSFRDVDWDHLLEQPAPYLPERSRELDSLLRRLEMTPSTAPEFPQLVKMLAANFDDFPERPVDSRERRRDWVMCRSELRRTEAVQQPEGRDGVYWIHV